MTNFDFIAPVYDALARLFFFGDILKAQCFFLKKINSNGSLLILGGGTGKVLEYIRGENEIDFVEPSVRMINRAKRRLSSGKVNFLNVKFQAYHSEKKYDFVLCPFFLDLFDSQSLEITLEKIKGLLNEKGMLIVTDFQVVRQSYWQIVISKVMHLFFRYFAGLQSESLKDMDRAVKSQGFVSMDEVFFYKEFIFSKVYIQLENE